jgi:hypothetical protein
MTGYQSKKAAALDEEGMYLVHKTDHQGKPMTYWGGVDFDIKTTPPAAQRTWVSLTDDQIKEIVGPWGDTPIKGYTRKLIDQIDAKLRENNNG